MSYRDLELHDAFKAYCFAAIRLAASRIGSFHPEDFHSHASWLDSIPFGRGGSASQPWHVLLIWEENEMRKLPEYSQLLERLNANPVIAAQLDKFVGNGEFHVERRHADFIDAVLFRLPVVSLKSVNAEAPVDDAAFDLVYARFEDEVYATELLVEAIAPLHGFRIESQEVRLDDETTISAFSPRELWHLPYWLPEDTRTPFAPKPSVAIRARYKSRKIIGESSETDQEEARKQRERVVEKIIRTSQVLTAFRNGSVLLQGIFVHSPHVHGTAYYTHESAATPYNPSPAALLYLLPANEGDAFTRFWHTMMSEQIRRFPAIEVALRRFHFANRRTMPEDGIVDLVIAAEAILLSGVDDPRYRSEIKYRFSTNAALAACGGMARDKAFSLFKEAYDLRSKIAHGSISPLTAKLPDREGRVSLFEFANVFDGELRAILKHAITRAADGGTPKDRLFPWNDLLLTALNSRPLVDSKIENDKAR